MIKKVREEFGSIYGNAENTRVYFAPGRVNLIGEHTDYNGGYVFPCGIDLGTYGVVREREDKNFCIYSDSFKEDGIITLNKENMRDFKKSSWTNYVKGVFLVFEDNDYRPKHGLDIYVSGNLPAGAGLSSSASLEVLIATILNEEFNFKIDKVEIALYSQVAEFKYNGCHCGVMDQFASTFAEYGKAVFLKSDTLDYEMVPLNMNEESIVITNSRVKHNLASSDYNKRREECEAAVDYIREVYDINNLCSLTPESFCRCENIIKDPVIRKRARHVIYENYRTILGVNALNHGNLARFGHLMYESHKSLKEFYEVSCRELDILVETAKNIPGVIGSRMTGGGFGGCTVSIIKNKDIDYFENVIYETYYKTTGIEAEFYRVFPGKGACNVL